MRVRHVVTLGTETFAGPWVEVDSEQVNGLWYARSESARALWVDLRHTAAVDIEVEQAPSGLPT